MPAMRDAKGRFIKGTTGAVVESAKAGGMGVEFLVGIEGLQQTIKSLQGFTPTLQKKILRKVMRKATRPVLQKAKAMVPVDTGKLQQNLKVRAVSQGRKRRRGLIGASVRTPARDKLDIDKDDRGYYPAVLEYGSAKRNIAPRGYLRKAKDAAKEEVRFIFRNQLTRIIDETASQLYHGKIDDRGVKIKAA
jgi:HK97 gp10 family phage protein